MRLSGLSLTYGAQNTAVGTALIVLILLWQFSYLLFAFRRVYADGWSGACAKAAVMVFVGFITANALAILAFLIAIEASLRVG